MKEIKQLNLECIEFFEDIDLQKWTQSHDNGYRYGWMTSNAAECKNGVFKEARMLPMTSLVRLTFYHTILYFERRRAEISEAVDRGEVYTEYAMKKLKRWETRASAHSVTSIDRETQTFEVHTICNYMHLTYAAYIDEYYLLWNFKRCYAGRFHPIQHPYYWPELSFTEVRPNVDLLKGPDRLRTTRIHNEMDWKESGQSLRYTICKVEGHNRQSFNELLLMDPGPVDDSHLYLQATYRSQSIWDTTCTVVLSCRRRETASQHTIPFDQRIAPYLEAAGFLEVSQVGFMQLDWHLITALVKRWRPETHTFHMPCGECMITLQDVALGVVPPDMKGQRLSLPWLAEQFEELPPDADIAGTYAWGTATLAWLYRELCRASNAQSLEIVGPLMLLQVWAYDRFSIVAPQRTLQHSDGRPLSFRLKHPPQANRRHQRTILFGTSRLPDALSPKMALSIIAW
ncbi:serine/threonine-protein phosphatase 7 long form-like protein [Cucumis melo var. makuwa]|uniref:Serine/threonine-protein phosphatase 7 long form-like protein n=1 Tax=Cucumis melo var. makuwa TaxID=1194695 RepID=A0A5A7UEQ8_CUCMM|nr:serine/threonine-protein phosphatase 7 long form-like protein [Cucumis melo var. makuwa]TYK14974.1 serine/threonine-protein phosphatase 7 long form-like protein [Cucumis melo var. makuwa]